MCIERAPVNFAKSLYRLFGLYFVLQFIFPQWLMGQSLIDSKVNLLSSDITDFDLKLEQGYTAFRVDGSLVDSVMLNRADTWLTASPDRILIWIISKNESQATNEIASSPLQNRLILEEHFDPSDRLENIEGRNFLVFGLSDNSEFSQSKWLEEFDFDSSLILQSSAKNYALLRDPLASQSMATAQLDSFINRTGKLPGFIETKRPTYFQKKVDSLNSVQWYRGIVMSNGQILDEVSWQHNPKLKTSGKFHVSEVRISPFKRGYHFSPDVMNFNAENSTKTKIFQAEALSINHLLRLHLDFEENIVNQANPDYKPLYSSIAYGFDEERGNHGVFNGTDSYIDFGILSSMNAKEVTISVWIKPHHVEKIYGLVGMGEVFAAKVFQGGLQFTTPDIKDHVLNGPLILQNTWQHVAFVYMADKQVLFYHNGKLVNDFVASGLTQSVRSLVVGTNLWDEYYDGQMDELFVWNRALSDEEIENVFLNPPQTSFSLESNLFLLLVGALVLVIGLFSLLIYFRHRKKSLAVSSLKNLRKIDPSNTKAGVYLFGGFKLINKAGKNLTALFSPKKKELFVLVLLYTFRKQGISSKEMANILWEGHSDESAKNNRSTQVKRLREILQDHTGIRIEYKEKLWSIEMDEEVYWDFLRYQELRHHFETATIQNVAMVVEEVMQVINQGVLLPHMHYEWLDPIKNQLSEELLELLTPLFTGNKFDLENQLLLRLTNVIFSFDSLNELALKYKIELLQEEGRHTMAMNAYEEYCNAYFQFYNEKYPIPFTELA